jgi:hypothetical protein
VLKLSHRLNRFHTNEQESNELLQNSKKWFLNDFQIKIKI